MVCCCVLHRGKLKMPLGEEKNGTCDRYKYDINLISLFSIKLYVHGLPFDVFQLLLLFFCKDFIFFTQLKALYSALDR